MGRYLLLVLMLATACEQNATVIDGGAVCIASDAPGSRDRPGTASVMVTEPIPLIVQAGFGCSTRVLFAECTVDIVDDEVIISSEMDVSTPGRLPWQGQELCLRLGTARCDMPPSTEGVTRIRYGDNVMDITVPGEAEGCISSQAGVTAG